MDRDRADAGARRLLMRAPIALGAASVLFFAACSSQRAPHVVEGPMQITSTAFAPGTPIPRRHTCDAENVSPPLAWTGAPPGTRAFALFCDDPDAPRGTWVHWVLYDLPESTLSLPEGARDGTSGTNDFRATGYGGPCPPPGKPHHYSFRLYALDAPTGLRAGAAKIDVEHAMKGHILAECELIGTYRR